MNNQTNTLRNTANFLASKMPSTNSNHPNPIETLSVDDIVYLQVYLEKIKTKKIELSKLANTAKTPVQSAPTPTSQATRIPKRLQAPPTLRIPQETDYHNPYSYGAKQNILKPTVLTPYHGPYANDPEALQQMGVVQPTTTPAHIRNVDVESSFLQREVTHLPGQREVTERNYNRFDLLPFDPQDSTHIVWCDNMPRGGYPTRNDRLELQ